MRVAELEESFEPECQEVGADRSRAFLVPLPSGGPSEFDFTISVVSSGESTVVRLAGELDLGTVPLLEEALVDELERGPRHLVLDLRRLEFCDAAGLRVFLRYRRRALESGARLRLVHPTPTVRRVLEVSELDWLVSDPRGRERVGR